MRAAEWFDWNDERVTVLRNLWGQGHSSARIASELGTSRNSVIGKVHRIGLEGRSRKPGGGTHG